MATVSHSPELLAPAGTLESAVIAYDAGADAVYAGLERFNARERGSNLSLDDMSKLVALARRLDKRVYVTVNTLVRDREMDDLTGMLADLATIRPDALIVQDIGVVRLAREHFPVLPVHASTQMAVHNSAGVHVAEQMGIRRVILERQMTFEEVAAVRRNTSAELEIFIHGALCCSRSGCCLFSSWMGGWSGNRGRCKQPCRRRYHSDSGNGFFFSPGDLCSIDAVPRLKTLGVASLKIEGRLKKGNYVQRVVRAYRMALDAEDGDKSAVKRARAELSGALGRRWVTPFRTREQFAAPVRHKRLGVSGLLCGNVTRAGSRGFEVNVARPFHVGDTIRVQPASGDEGPGFAITRLSVDRRNVNAARRGQACWVHYDREVPRGASVFLVSTSPPDLGSRLERLPTADPVVDLEIAADATAVRVTIVGLGAEWQSPWHAEPAQKRSLSSETLRHEFARSADSGLAAGNVTADVTDGLFVPASALKALRRGFWNWASAEIDAQRIRGRWSTAGDALPAPEHMAAEATVLSHDGAPRPGEKDIVARRLGALSAVGRTDEVVIPDFCAETDLPALRAAVAEALAQGVRRLRVTSLYGCDLLPHDDDLTVTTSFPLPACNRWAIAELRALGADKVQAWVELDGQSMRDLAREFRGAIEIYSYGRVPILFTRFAIPADGHIRDGRGAGFETVEQNGETVLLPEKVLKLPPIPDASSFVDLTHAAPDEQDTTDFNFSRDFV